MFTQKAPQIHAVADSAPTFANWIITNTQVPQFQVYYSARKGGGEMTEVPRRRGHRLIDKMVIHVETNELGHEIAYDRLREILDGYEDLLGTLEDERTYNPDDTRTQQQESAEMKLSHKLYLTPATEGSYAVEARLYDDSDNVQPTLPFEEQGFSRVLTVIDCVANGDPEQFARTVPSKLARQHVLDGIRRVSPRPTERIRVISGIEMQRTTELKQADIIPFNILKPIEDDYSDAEVIGRIASVDFESKKLKLRPNGSKRRFTISYDKEIEDHLMQARHKLMTVKCRVRYNVNGDIADISNAAGIEELVLHDVTIKSFDADGVTHTFKNPITVAVKLDDETKQVYLGTFEKLDLCVYVEHQDEMRQEILDDLAWRWSSIVQADESELAPDAVAVRRTFLSLVAE